MAEVLQPLLKGVDKPSSSPATPSAGPPFLDLEKQPLASILTFWFMNPMFEMGSRKTIALDDCPVLGPFDQGHVHYENFKSHWDAGRERCREKLPSLTLALWQAFW